MTEELCYQSDDVTVWNDHKLATGRKIVPDGTVL